MTPAETSAYLRARCVDSGDCLHWYTKAKTENRRRHPMLCLPGEEKPVLVRRALYEAECGPIREGYLLAPKCSDKYCIEPEHQKQISTRQRSQLGAEAGATSPTRGPAVRATRQALGLSKLSLDQVRQIRESDETGLALAARLGVHNKTISDARRQKTWPDASNPFGRLL